MLRLDVLFAERNFSENHCSRNRVSVAKMNSYSSKRKREVEQYMTPEVASGVYQGLGMGRLTTPITTGDYMEVEPPRKRIQVRTDKTVLQNTLVNHSADKAVLGGATPLLSNGQIQQFINSTVIPENPTITNGLSSSGSKWSMRNPDGRPTLQNFCENDMQKRVRIPATNDMRALSQQFVISSGRPQQYMLPATMGYSFPQNSSVAQRQATLQQTTSTPTSCNLQSGVQQYVQIVSADGTTRQMVPVVQAVPQSDSAPKPKKARRKLKHLQSNGVHNVNGQPTAQLTNTYHMTSDVSQHSSQTSQIDQFRSMYLTPQTIPAYVKPAEARTRHETKSPKRTLTNVSHTKTEVPRNFCQKVDAVSNRQQRETTANKSKSRHTAQSSTKKAGGKKNVECDVFPPKTEKDHVDYPPYVHRIMRILNRAEQRSQAEKSSKEKDTATSTQITKERGEKMAKKCSQPTNILFDNTSIEMHGQVKATGSGERSLEKYPRPTALKRQTNHENVTGGMKRITEQRNKPASESQRLRELCSTTNKKCSQVKATECKQVTAYKYSRSNGDKSNQTGGNKRKKESRVKKVFPVETHASKVEVDKVLEELFPASSDVTLLEADSFYGPEHMVTC